MILFFVGIIEMAIATYWTRFVTNANVRMTGLITGVNFAIWYYVIRQLVENLDDWYTIVPYGAGCVAGAMLGVAFDLDVLMTRAAKWYARRVKVTTAARLNRTKASRAPGPIAIDYDHP